MNAAELLKNPAAILPHLVELLDRVVTAYEKNVEASVHRLHQLMAQDKIAEAEARARFAREERLEVCIAPPGCMVTLVDPERPARMMKFGPPVDWQPAEHEGECRGALECKHPFHYWTATAKPKAAGR
jgi:hypothetical protein